MTFPSMTDREQRLAIALERLAESQQNGETVDVETELAADPDLEDELRELWATAQIARLLGASEMTGVAPPVDVAPLELPCTFGEYELIEELGRGGMGIVYRARHIPLDRIVALKMLLHGAVASPDDLARFRAEAESAGRLNHPGIVPVYEIGTHEGHAFFTMQCVEGETLSQRLATGPLGAREAATLLRDVSRAVHAAHVGGVLHRDIKPSNIMIDMDGRPHVTDFGLARRVIGHETMTRTGAILGTPSYLAPEQAAGNRGELGPATDVYGLGAVLYQMLTGRPPFQAPTPLETVFLVLEQEVVPPRLLNARADRDLEAITIRCLQKPADLRYETASSLAEDLDAYLTGEPIAARSGRFQAIVSGWFRETHHVAVLENWGLLWIWHAVVLLALCIATSAIYAMGVRSPVAYVGLWGGGLAIWSPIFWAIRRRAGPVTFVERQVAHLWGGSVIASVGLFAIEGLMGLPVLALSPVLALINGMVFTAKAGILSGEFYVHAAVLFATSAAMGLLAPDHIEWAILLFGIVSAGVFLVPGIKYYRRARR